MGRILAIDYGTKRTGIAVSDPLRLIAGGLDTVDTKGLEAWLAKYFASEDVSTIVVGKPSRMDGTPSETWRFIEPLAVRLRKAWPDKEVVFHDERFTSVMAHRTMRLPATSLTLVPANPLDRKSTRLNSSHRSQSRMPSSA